ncbi:endoglucanase [Kitasatospora sp. MAA19]|uniref:glycoside hydrolase family 9 protein n=1 Tax=Kitasatospora sp. MAA19 TaxID=3035090 RepID=UPI0024742C2A|nr:glycoside hydrolase family 9 protein [Kitasatospora sp. MAA19]MDH6703408.1 endoglucanase [Kitasatospora sp. MAA19]
MPTFPAGLTWSLRSTALLATTALGIGAVFYALPESGTTTDGDPSQASPAAIRVDQVGYAVGEAKQAFVMGTEAGLSRAGYRLVDEHGTTVATGQVGSRTGTWNSKYPDVHTVDLSAVDVPGSYRLELTGTASGSSPKFRIAPAKDLLTPLIEDNVRFFQAQRDGADVLPDVMHRKPSHLADRTATVYATPHYNEDGTQLLDTKLTPVGGPIDVSGGWSDAGDFLKFTHTTAYSTADLLLALRTAPHAAGLADEAKQGLAWLDKMWDGRTGTLYAQVGIGAGNDNVRTDHDVWRLPEADDKLDVKPGDPDYLIKNRPVFRANEPGAAISPNLAGRVAAVFALAAQSSAKSDPAAAKSWLNKAAAVYAKADTEPGDELVTAFPHNFYPEDSWQDDMEFGAAEMSLAAKALGDGRAAGWQQQAGHWAKQYIGSDTKGTLGVADVSALAHADLLTALKTGGDSGTDSVTPADLQGDLRRQLDDGVNRAAKDPFRAGAVYTDFDSVPHTFGLVATAQLYGKATGDHHYDAFGAQQRGWALGANSWGSTFMIGAGEVYPHCPEHQLANLGGSLDGTGEILRGAVVNGPNAAEKLAELNTFPTMKRCSSNPGTAWTDFDGAKARFLDDAGAWQTVEPSVDFTSTAMLAFALSQN